METSLPVFVIDGNNFHDEDSFFAHMRSQYIWVDYFGDTLNAFGELLLSGFNTDQRPYRLVWRNAEKSSRELEAEDFWKELLEVIDEYKAFISLELD